MWSASMPLLPESQRWRLTICGVVARDFVIRPEANWIKFSSCLATSPFKLRSATSAANNESGLRSMIAWESSHQPEEAVCSAYELPTTTRSGSPGIHYNRALDGTAGYRLVPFHGNTGLIRQLPTMVDADLECADY